MLGILAIWRPSNPILQIAVPTAKRPLFQKKDPKIWGTIHFMFIEWPWFGFEPLCVLDFDFILELRVLSRYTGRKKTSETNCSEDGIHTYCTVYAWLNFFPTNHTANEGNPI